MNIELLRNDGEVEFHEWPNQKALEVDRDALFVGTAESGLMWLLYNPFTFRWDELNIAGDVTGKSYKSFKIGVM